MIEQGPKSSSEIFHPGDSATKVDAGGKGFGLLEMYKLGMPVPAFFTISTQVGKNFIQSENTELSEGLKTQIASAMSTDLEKSSGKKFGDPKNPLLVSVRSGSQYSMPGMMDTVLNLGINDEIAQSIADVPGKEVFAYDSYVRFIQGYGKIVLGISDEKLQTPDTLQKNAESLKKEVARLKQIVVEETGRELPEDPKIQLESAIKSVFNSWNSKRAVDYRTAMNIPHDLGTAATIQEMKFGNQAERSGTGVLLTRDPNTGENEFFGNFSLNAQGEDIVSGTTNSGSISELRDAMPEVYEKLVTYAKILEEHFGYPQDIEFTVQDGVLYLLQTRSIKPSPEAAIKIAISLVKEGKTTIELSVKEHVTTKHIDMLLHSQFDADARLEALEAGRLLTVGVAASPGATSGNAVFDVDEVANLKKLGHSVILVRPETTPKDIHGILPADGVVTGKGGLASHAALVTRGQGIPALVGASEIVFNSVQNTIQINGNLINEGEVLSIDGGTGEMFSGYIKTVQPDLSEIYGISEFMTWTDQLAKIAVWANTDDPKGAREARDFGAKGIGLCRTEHMFSDEKRQPIFQKVLFADKPENYEIRELLNRLKDTQREDFKGILEAMNDLPVVIRLLDAPMNEFLPEGFEKDENLSRFKESNPMLGFRGVRLGIVRPDIYEMQVSAILEAAGQLIKEKKKPKPKIMIPLISTVEEVIIMREMVDRVALKVNHELGMTDNPIPYDFGIMVETPGAVVNAGEIASLKTADGKPMVRFMSFGSNDLTQMTMGMSRDDIASSFIPKYIELGILKVDPFQIMVSEVRKLVEMATEQAKAANPDIEIGICGEHGGDPETIKFLHKIGLDYASSSPFRVMVARLSAAQAALDQAA